MKSAILFALLALHLSLAYTGGIGWSHHNEWLGDRYDCLAHNLLSGVGYIDCQSSLPTAYRLPGYPIALAGMFAGFSDSEPAARLFQSVLSAMIVFVVVTFTLNLGGNGWMAGSAAVSSWMLYHEAAWLQTETVFAFCLLLFVVVFWQRHYIASGTLLGILLLTRGTLLFAVPLLLLLVPVRKLPLFLLPVAVLVCVWTVRNYYVFAAIIPFSTGAGEVIWGANNPVSYAQLDGLWISPTLLPGWSEVKDLPEVEQDRTLTARALAFMRSTPPSVLVNVTLAKLHLFWDIKDATTTWPERLLILAVPLGLLRRLWARRR